MPGFFEALNNMPQPQEQKPKVTIGGKQYEVELPLFKEIMKYGEEEYHVKDGAIVRKPVVKKTYTYAKLQKGEKGFSLLDNDVHWPIDHIDGGYEWTR